MMRRAIMRRLLVLLTVLACLFPATAFASAVEETRQLALALDLPSLEFAFQGRQHDFRHGRIPERDYRAPYSVFETTDPDVQAATAAWLAVYPRSGHAMTARGLALSHLALLYRGGDYASLTPRRAISKMRRLLAEATPLLSAAIDADSSNLAAAFGLVSAAAHRFAPFARSKGVSVIERWAGPDRATLLGLRNVRPWWGGLSSAIKDYCAERTAHADRLTNEQCVAVSNYNRGLDIDNALEVLDAGPVDLFLEYQIKKRVRGDLLEEAKQLADAQGYMTLSLAQDLRSRLDDAAPLKRYVTSNLKRDPLNPYLLAELSRLRSASFDPAGARKALDKAMVYGGHWPHLRLTRIRGAPPTEAFSELVGALDNTEYNFEVLAESVGLLMLSSTIIGEDAVRPPDFECQRMQILERHAAVCEAGADHGSCNGAFRRDTMIAEARRADACGTGGERKWQDYVRDLFGLNE
jgi:hypothetical protein